MTNDGTYSYTWDAEGRMLSGGGVTYTYDGNGGRVKKSSGTLYWHDLSGALLTETDTSGNLINDYIYFGGVRVARVSSTSTYFYYSDALGTSRTITDSTGHTCYDADTYPFGGNLTFTSSCSQNFQFAGTYHDSETGLEHTWFRQYTSNSGRWLSPDLLGGDLSNPQSLNRYAYVTNDPASLTDLLGLQEGLTPPTPGDTCQNVMAGADRATACIGVYQSSNPNFFAGYLPTWGWADPFDLMHIPEVIGDVSSTVVGITTHTPVLGDGLQLALLGSGSGPGGSASAANNGWTWAWNFTKSFFTFAGGPGNVPTCAGQALFHMGETLNPFTPGVSTAADLGAPVAQAAAINRDVAQTEAGIDAYVAGRGLTVPLRSSIVRSMAAEGAEGAVEAGTRANVAVQTFAVDYAALKSTYLTSKEARSGGCSAAFPVF